MFHITQFFPRADIYTDTAAIKTTIVFLIFIPFILYSLFPLPFTPQNNRFPYTRTFIRLSGFFSPSTRPTFTNFA